LHFSSLFFFSFFPKFFELVLLFWVVDGFGDGRSGLAGTHASWGPQIKELVGTDTPNDDETRTGDWSSDDNESGGGIEICAFDNRGMGRSSVPTKKSEYT
jgi:hypothetical protein